MQGRPGFLLNARSRLFLLPVRAERPLRGVTAMGTAQAPETRWKVELLAVFHRSITAAYRDLAGGMRSGFRAIVRY